MADPMSTYVPDSQYRNVVSKVATTPTAADLQSYYQYNKQNRQLKKSLQSYAKDQGITEFQAQNPSPNWLEQGLDYLSRPLQAITGGISHTMKGEDFFSGMGEGIQGQGDAKNVSDLLEQAGTGDLGELNVGPFSIKGRDVLGFVGDVALDPTTYLGAGLGKGIKAGVELLGKGAQAVSAAGKAAKIADWAETASNVSSTGITKAAQKIKPANWVLNMISPIDAKSAPVKQGLNIWQRQRTIATNVAETARAEFNDIGKVFNFVTEDGTKAKKGLGTWIELKGADGQVIREQWNDLFSAADTHFKLGDITQAQYDYIKKYTAYQADLAEWATKNGVEIPEIKWGEDVEYVSRPVADPNKATIPPSAYVNPKFTNKIGKEQFYQKSRANLSGAEMESVHGVQYYDPLDSMYLYSKRINESVADQQLRTYLLGTGKTLSRDVESMGIIEQGIASAKATREQINTLRSYYLRARNRNLTPNELEKISKLVAENPDLKYLAEPLQATAELNIKPVISALSSLAKKDRKVVEDSFSRMKGRFSDAGPLDVDIMDPNLNLDAITAESRGVRRNLRGIKQSALQDYLINKEHIGYGLNRIKEALGGKITTPKYEGFISDNMVGLFDQGANRFKSGIPGMPGTMGVRGEMKSWSAAKKELEAFEADLLSGSKTVAQPAFKNMFFNPQDAKEISHYLNDSADKFVKQAGKVGTVSRVATVGSDFGGIFIQGLPLLATDPTAWGKATVKSFAAWATPKIRQNYLRENVEFLKKHPELGLDPSTGEFYEALGQKVIGAAEKEPGKIGTAVGKAAAPAKNILGRFQESFETFGTIARVEMAKSLEPVWAKAGKSMSSLDHYVNEATGFMSTKGMGVSATQREAENAFLFFAPRYLRASLALVADAASDTGLKGWQARRSILTMMGAGAAMYKHVADMTGQEPIMDPSDGRFMTLQVGNDRVGLGSIWMSLARLVGKAVEEPESMTAGLPWNPEEWKDNPLMMWVRSRGAPLSTTAIDLVSGESYIGEPINDIGSLGKYALSKVLPFGVESSMPYQTPPADWASKPFELMGMRNFPQGYSDRRQMELEKLTGDKTIKYKDADPYLAAQADKATRNLGLPVRGDENQQRTLIFDQQDTDMNNLYQQLSSGALNKNQYRQARNSIKSKTAAKLEMLDTNETESARAKRLAGLSANEQARQKYYELLRTKDEYGNTDWLRADAFLAMQPDSVQKYIDDVTAAKLKTLDPGVAEIEISLFNARKTLRPYFELFDVELSKRGMLKKYYEMTPAQQDAYLKSDTGKAINKAVTKAKENMRRSNSKIDNALVEWYGLTPISKQK